jgi:hypothetical protein
MPAVVGTMTTPLWTLAVSESLMSTSLPAKSTVAAVKRAMPSPLPTASSLIDTEGAAFR